LVRRAGAKMRCVRRMFGRKEHWFDEECWEKRRQTMVALRKFKEKDGLSRTEYWAKRKAYERMVGKKRCMRQEKEAEYINKLVCEKDINKIWKAVRKIVRGKEFTACVEPNEWVRHFQDLFSKRQ
jgi:primosomal protein N''